MNNKEKAKLKQIKEMGYSYELKYYPSIFGGEYYANIPKLKETWCLGSCSKK